MVDLRAYVFLDSLQPQFASFQATISKGYLPKVGQASLFVEIAPGMVLPPPGRDQDYADQWAARNPSQRIGSPGEIVKTLLFLLASDFITGDLIYVTGGEHLLVGKDG